MLFTRKEPTLKELNSDAQVLMNFLMNEAQGRLKAQGGFQPFAAAMAEQGTLSLLAGEHPAETPARVMAERLTAQLRSLIESGMETGIEARIEIRIKTGSEAGGMRAAGLAADVSFGKQNSGERADAVRLHIEHRNGYCADIFVPYKIRTSRRNPDALNRDSQNRDAQNRDAQNRDAQNRVRFSHPVAQESDRRFWVLAKDVS
jgi:hypothetical protein